MQIIHYQMELNFILVLVKQLVVANSFIVDHDIKKT